MNLRKTRIPVGLRTIKTAVAVILSMIIVELFGASESKLIFAMLGAMAAVQPTYKESLESSLTQIVGVVFGAAIAVVLVFLRLPPLMATGIGIIVVITLYNLLKLRFSPSLPCLIVVMLCIGAEERPFIYALERIFYTAIGLVVGMVLNMLVFPYDNSRQIRATAENLDKELIAFLEDFFDGDDVLPDAEVMHGKIADMERQLTIYSNQKLFLRLRRQRKELNNFKIFEQKARVLVAQMEVLSHMPSPGRLNADNRLLLAESGANIQDNREIDNITEQDIITNYHVSQILKFRRELMDILSK